MRSHAAGPLVGLGLLYGAGVGTVLGVVIAGAPNLATWMVMGAGIGVVVGSVAELWRDVARRTAHGPTPTAH
ncbi:MULTISPECIES: hypothetical protein [Mycobacteriales]|uniref:Uncharacterized protein n=2 Tax=Dietzia TaxID=37914 RepID=A0A365PAN3_9ACTN|nr:MULTISPECIES: hypothetical protein [Mycobacteriales]MVZ89886.1 hypothetical protein [Microbacter sp. ANSKLAB05]MBB1011650.1 hypothetical protein [Dietzia kunjamensis]MCY1657876.1 hypothetical protein [Dietzia sp. SL131]MDV6298489.1 hypothetical protein [Dietzia maris]RBA36270.1 hypothetical protein DQ226_09120 [Dietzia maris]